MIGTFILFRFSNLDIFHFQLGIIAFNESTNPKNLASIIIGLGAGVLFVRIKQS